MTETPEDQPSREELLRARDDIRKAIDLLESPIDSRNSNPDQIEKLRVLWDEINELIGEDKEA